MPKAQPRIASRSASRLLSLFSRAFAAYLALLALASSGDSSSASQTRMVFGCCCVDGGGAVSPAGAGGADAVGAGAKAPPGWVAEEERAEVSRALVRGMASGGGAAAAPPPAAAAAMGCTWGGSIGRGNMCICAMWATGGG